MRIDEYEQQLRKKKQTLIHLDRMKGFEKYLKKELQKSSIESSTIKDLEDFVLWQLDNEQVPHLGFMIVYSRFIEDSKMESSVRDLSRKYKSQITEADRKRKERPWWINNLSAALDKRVGAKLRKRILQGRDGIKQTASAVKKVTFARDIIERMEDSVDEDTSKEVLSCGLHRRTMNTLERWRKEFAKVNDVDKFLEIKRQKFLAKWGLKSKKLKEWILKHPECEVGIRFGNVIHVCKVPHQDELYFKATDEAMRRYHYCHCGWAKESL
ncbi:MAG: hypothetical protein ACTSU3_07560, partial [Candidatus Thorarchaeota archaeon]